MLKPWPWPANPWPALARIISTKREMALVLSTPICTVVKIWFWVVVMLNNNGNPPLAFLREFASSPRATKSKSLATCSRIVMLAFTSDKLQVPPSRITLSRPLFSVASLLNANLDPIWWIINSMAAQRPKTPFPHREKVLAFFSYRQLVDWLAKIRLGTSKYRRSWFSLRAILC